MAARHIVLGAVPGVPRNLDSAVALRRAAEVGSLLVEEGKGCFEGDIDLATVGNAPLEVGVLPVEDTVLLGADNNLRQEAAVHAGADTGLEVDTDPAAEDIAVGVVDYTGPDSLVGRRGKTFATRFRCAEGEGDV